MLPLLKHLGWDPDSPLDSLDNSLLYVTAELVRPDVVSQIMSGSSSPFNQNSEGDLPLHRLLRVTLRPGTLFHGPWPKCFFGVRQKTSSTAQTAKA